MRDDLIECLEIAKHRGFLGPGPVEDHIKHAQQFSNAYDNTPEGKCLDLGSGGGIPGLVLALHWKQSSWVFADSSEKRTQWLQEAILALGLDNRCSVLRGRAEELARSKEHTSQYRLVTARGFGPPAVTAECATGFLQIGGTLLVSEPPDSQGTRWNHPDLLLGLGYKLGELKYGCQLLTKIQQEESKYPRRVGMPLKRPLFV